MVKNIRQEIAEDLARNPMTDEERKYWASGAWVQHTDETSTKAKEIDMYYDGGGYLQDLPADEVHETINAVDLATDTSIRRRLGRRVGRRKR